MIRCITARSPLCLRSKTGRVWMLPSPAWPYMMASEPNPASMRVRALMYCANTSGCTVTSSMNSVMRLGPGSFCSKGTAAWRTAHNCFCSAASSAGLISMTSPPASNDCRESSCSASPASSLASNSTSRAVSAEAGTSASMRGSLRRTNRKKPASMISNDVGLRPRMGNTASPAEKTVGK